MDTLGGTGEDHLCLFPGKYSTDRDLSGFGQRAGNLYSALLRRHLEGAAIRSAVVNPKGLEKSTTWIPPIDGLSQQHEIDHNPQQAKYDHRGKYQSPHKHPQGK